MIYILLFLMTAILVGFAMSTNSVVVVVVAALILATFAALRGADVAADFMVYQDWYSSRDVGNGFLDRPGFFEAIYFGLNDFFAMCSISFRVFVWCMAFVAVFFKTKIIVFFSKSGWSAGVSILIYTFTFYLLHEFTQIRVGLAIAFIFLAVHALVNGSRTNFVLMVVLATGFHSSAVMAFFLLLPYRSPRAYWVDFVLFGISGMVFALAMHGIFIAAALLNVLTEFDPRLAIYISLADIGQVEAANPFAVSVLLLLTLAISLIGVKYNNNKISNLNDFDIYAMILVRRSILVGFICLGSLSSVPELALRLFEINISLVPILAAVIFSQRGWMVQKSLLFFWAGTLAFIYIARDEGLVQPYVLFFS